MHIKLLPPKSVLLNKILNSFLSIGESGFRLNILLQDELWRW